MLGNFTYHNPTKLYFGENALDNLSIELSNYGNAVFFKHSKHIKSKYVISGDCI